MSRYAGVDFINGSTQEILSGILEKDKEWGFVIIRCFYEDQEKWETFLSLAKERVLHQINSRDINLPDIAGQDIYKNLALTVIEDKEALADASVDVTTNRFVEWVKSDGVHSLRIAVEVQDLDVESFEGEELLMNLPNIPRYQYYIHANQEMIESYSTDLDNIGSIVEDDPNGGGWRNARNYLYVESPSAVLAEARWREEDGEDAVDQEGDAGDQGNRSKKIRGATLMDVYVRLLAGFDYLYDHKDEGFWVVA